MRFELCRQRGFFLGQEVEVVADAVYSIRQVGRWDAGGQGDTARREDGGHGAGVAGEEGNGGPFIVEIKVTDAGLDEVAYTEAMVAHVEAVQDAALVENDSVMTTQANTDAETASVPYLGGASGVAIRCRGCGSDRDGPGGGTGGGGRVGGRGEV